MARRSVHSAFEGSATISGISFASGDETSLTITCCPLSKRRANYVGAATNGRNEEPLFPSQSVKVWNRRVSLLAARSRAGLLSEPTAVARHLCDGSGRYTEAVIRLTPAG